MSLLFHFFFFIFIISCVCVACVRSPARRGDMRAVVTRWRCCFDFRQFFARIFLSMVFWWKRIWCLVGNHWVESRGEVETKEREGEREMTVIFVDAQCAVRTAFQEFLFSFFGKRASLLLCRCFGCFGKHKLIGTFPFDHFFCPSTVRGLRMPWNGCDTYPLNGSVTNWICIFSSFFCFEYSNSFNTRLSGLVRVWVRENWKPIIFRDFNDCEQFMAFDRSPQATTTCLSFEMFYGPKLYFEHWLWSRYPLLIEILLASRCSYKHFS